jgi:hypothetical protein
VAAGGEGAPALCSRAERQPPPQATPGRGRMDVSLVSQVRLGQLHIQNARASTYNFAAPLRAQTFSVVGSERREYSAQRGSGGGAARLVRFGLKWPISPLQHPSVRGMLGARKKMGIAFYRLRRGPDGRAHPAQHLRVQTFAGRSRTGICKHRCLFAPPSAGSRPS